MSLQQSLVTEASARFPGLDANSLVGELLARIRNGAGGPTGFVNDLRAKGLSDAVAGWMRQDWSREPTVEQADDALGRRCVEQAASGSGISVETASRQLAFLLPRAVAGAVAEDERAMYASMPPPAVAWAILVALLLAVGGLYWWVTADSPRAERRQSVAAERPAGATAPKAERPKPETPPEAARPALPEVVETRPAPAAEPTALPEPVPAPARNGQRGNRFALASLEALKPGASGKEITAALNLSVINFASGSANIPKDKESVAMLRRAATLLTAAPNGTRIEIAGHTDNTGDPAYNVYLSEKRAKAVRDELIKGSVKADALVAKGYGGARPLVPNDTREGRARNRRIEFTVLP